MSPAAQRNKALARANAVRLAGAERRREIGAHPRPQAFREAALLLASPPPEVQRMRAGHFLLALPNVGPKLAQCLLRAAGIHNAARHVGPAHGQARRPLTERQRFALAARLLRASRTGLRTEVLS